MTNRRNLRDHEKQIRNAEGQSLYRHISIYGLD